MAERTRSVVVTMSAAAGDGGEPSTGEGGLLDRVVDSIILVPPFVSDGKATARRHTGVSSIEGGSR